MKKCNHFWTGKGVCGYYKPQQFKCRKCQKVVNKSGIVCINGQLYYGRGL